MTNFGIQFHSPGAGNRRLERRQHVGSCRFAQGGRAVSSQQFTFVRAEHLAQRVIRRRHFAPQIERQYAILEILQDGF